MNYNLFCILCIISTVVVVKIYLFDKKNMEIDIIDKRIKVTLPEKLKIGYANWNECDDKIFEAVQNGLNVIIWFSVDLSSKDGKPFINRGPNFADVAKMIKKFK